MSRDGRRRLEAGDDFMTEGQNHLEVSLLICLAPGAGYWLGPKLERQVENQCMPLQVLSPWVNPNFLIAWLKDSKNEHPKRRK